MNKYKKLGILSLVGLGLLFVSFVARPQSASYKCLIQMINYNGEAAYLIVSLIDPEGQYEQTLYVHGDDYEWYPDLTEWWNYFDGKGEEIDAITGATIGGGQRAMSVFEVDKSKIDAGYKIRFETAVEDQEYHVADIEFDLTSSSVPGKYEGDGYIRYIRIAPS
ncbi:MAG: DUF2271 domain-containing protein [Bacteroidota bacterium]